MYHYYDEDTSHLSLYPWGVSSVEDVKEEQKNDSVQADLLWKPMLEDIFEDFLCFFFPDAPKHFDLERGFEYLDKELDQLFPPENSKYAPRHVDKLVKVFTREGHEEWILLHVEVQGYNDSHFAERMFRYFCRIWDKYQRTIIPVVIYTYDTKGHAPDRFEQMRFNTGIRYLFKTYHILEQDEAELERSNNPLAMTALIVQAAAKAKKLKDGDIYPLKMKLVRLLHNKQLSAKKIRRLMNFLRYTVLFKNPEMNAKFDQEITPLQEGETLWESKNFYWSELKMKVKRE